MERKEKALIGLCLFAALALGVLFGAFLLPNLYIYLFAADAQGPVLDSIFLFFTTIFDTKFFVCLSAILLGVLFINGKKRETLMGIAVLGGGAAMEWILKQVLMQDRPIGYFIYETGYGFPSGHAVKVTLMALFLVYMFKDSLKTQMQQNAFSAVCIAAIIIVCLSRIYLGVHWATDVLGGFLFAYAWTNWVFFVFSKKR